MEMVSNVSGIPDDAEWYYTPASRTFQEKIWKVKALHDTIFNDQVFKIIGIDKGQGVIEESKIPIAIVNNKMIFLEKGESHLYYDFSAKIGDTITYKVPSLAYYYDITFNNGFTRPELPSFQIVVDKIDTVFSSEGIMLKNYSFQSLFENTEYEHGFFNIAQNIGSIQHGFFGSFGPYLTIDREGYFRCYKSSVLNYNSLNKDCLSSSIDESKTNDLFKIYPNPTVGNLKLEGVMSKIVINLYSIDGVVLKTFRTDTNSELDISDLNSGLYIISIKNQFNQLLYYSKIVKF